MNIKFRRCGKIYAWPGVWTAGQLQVCDESAEQLITWLHQMAENCEIGNFKNKMTRDHLGIWGDEYSLVTFRASTLTESSRVGALLPNLRNWSASAKQVSEALWKNCGRYYRTISWTAEVKRRNTGTCRLPLWKPPDCPQHQYALPVHDIVCYRCKHIGPHYIQITMVFPKQWQTWSWHL